MGRFFSRLPGIETLLWVAVSVFAIIAFLLIAPAFFAAVADMAEQPTPNGANAKPPAVTTSLPPFAAAPRLLTPIPTPGPGSQLFDLVANVSQSGWFRSSESQVHWGDSNINVGLYKDVIYQGVFYFDLSRLAPGTRVSFADLQMTGADRSRLGSTGTWRIRMLKPNVQLNPLKQSSADLAQAPIIADIGREVGPEDLGPRVVNQWIFSPENLQVLEQAIDTTGIVIFRIDGSIGTGDNLFTWAGGFSGSTGGPGPVLHMVAQVGQFVSVTNTPTPQNIVTAAAQAQTQVAFAAKVGTSTPLPRNYATVTPAGLVAPQPAGVNQPTAVSQSPPRSPVAVTTRITTTMPLEGATSIPPLVLVRTPIPADMRGYIAFLWDDFGTRRPLLMSQDGTLLQPLARMDLYNAASARDQFNPDRTQQVIVKNDSAGMLQVSVQDLRSGALTLISNVKSEKASAYDPAWSPDGAKIVYVSTESGLAELYVFDFATRNSRRLTNSPSGVYNQHPSWSPDSRRIVFNSNRETGRPQIWMVNSDGSGLHNLSTSLYSDMDPVWMK